MQRWKYKTLIYSVKPVGFLKEGRVWRDPGNEERGPCERSSGDFHQAMRQLGRAL